MYRLWPAELPKLGARIRRRAQEAGALTEAFLSEPPEEPDEVFEELSFDELSLDEPSLDEPSLDELSFAESELPELSEDEPFAPDGTVLDPFRLSVR
jgi:hypothetical protein